MTKGKGKAVSTGGRAPAKGANPDRKNGKAWKKRPKIWDPVLKKLVVRPSGPPPEQPRKAK